MATDLLSKIADELDARLRELRPLLSEYQSLLDAAAALELAGDEESTPRNDLAERRPVSAPAASGRRSGRAPSKRSSRRSAARATAQSAPDVTAPIASKPAARRKRGTAKPADRAPKSVEPASEPVERAPKRAQRGAAAMAILAALEHGSHSVSELAVVTAMGTSIINGNLRRLQQAGAIARTKREGDGKAAYALVSAAV